MSEDIRKRRQLLRERLEGKLEDNQNSKPKIVVKSARLHIPTIFQSGSQENLVTQTKSHTVKNTSKSTGNLHKELSFKLPQSNQPPLKPPRKSKSKENLSELNGQTLPSISSSNVENQHFLSSNEDLKDESKFEPVIVEMRTKPGRQEENTQEKAQSGQVLLRNKKSDLNINRNSLDIPSTYYDFTNRSPSPKSPLFKTLEKNSSLRRSGSRVGFTAERDLKKSEEEKRKKNEEKGNNDKEGLYDNVKLKNIFVYQNEESGKEDINNNKQRSNENIIGETNNSKEVLYENLDVFRANKYYSKKIILGPTRKAPIPNKRGVKPQPRKRTTVDYKKL